MLQTEVTILMLQRLGEFIYNALNEMSETIPADVCRSPLTMFGDYGHRYELTEDLNCRYAAVIFKSDTNLHRINATAIVYLCNMPHDEEPDPLDWMYRKEFPISFTSEASSASSLVALRSDILHYLRDGKLPADLTLLN